jgi:hypothetical protein
MAQSPCFLSPLAESLLLPFRIPFTYLETLLAVTGSVHLGLRLLIYWPPLSQPFPQSLPPPNSQNPGYQAPHYVLCGRQKPPNGRSLIGERPTQRKVENRKAKFCRHRKLPNDIIITSSRTYNYIPSSGPRFLNIVWACPVVRGVD